MTTCNFCLKLEKVYAGIYLRIGVQPITSNRCNDLEQQGMKGKD